MRPRPVVLLCAYLAGWIPLNTAALVSRSLPSVTARGANAVVELAAHSGAAALCLAAAWMLWNHIPAGRLLAAVALIVHTALFVQGLHASMLPRDVRPGLAGPVTLIAVVHSAGWLVYLRRSAALRRWLD